MSESEMARLAEHAKANPDFLEEFKQDPVNAARGAGFTVSRHEAAAMGDFSELSDDEVITVISNFWMIERPPNP